MHGFVSNSHHAIPTPTSEGQQRWPTTSGLVSESWNHRLLAMLPGNYLARASAAQLLAKTRIACIATALPWLLSQSKLRYSTEAPFRPKVQLPRLAKAHPTGGKCAGCGALYTFGLWAKHSDGGVICRRCQNDQVGCTSPNRAHPDRACTDCGSARTSRWYSHSSENGAFRCTICYDRYTAQRANLDGRVCHDCGAKHSYKWIAHTPKAKNGLYRCGFCSNKFYLNRKSRVCRDCGTKYTSRWLSHPSGDGSFRCKACYMREYRRVRKVRQRTPTAEIPINGKTAGSGVL
ncbi:unnamed protein product [Peniophora sp. CBMAI 1063]|nr:unnamed protein product [Peniophora sp. CBMAI 1063]